jgi:hypothetical protein
LNHVAPKQAEGSLDDPLKAGSRICIRDGQQCSTKPYEYNLVGGAWILFVESTRLSSGGSTGFSRVPKSRGLRAKHSTMEIKQFACAYLASS